MKLNPSLKVEKELADNGKWRYLLYNDGVMFYKSAARYKTRARANIAGQDHRIEVEEYYHSALVKLIVWNRKIEENQGQPND